MRARVRVEEAAVLGMDLDQIAEKDRPETTFGTKNDDVLAYVDPSFEREDFVAKIQAADWAE